MTHAQPEKKATRIEESIEKVVDRHRGEDDRPMEPDRRKKEETVIEHLQQNAKRIRSFLRNNEERLGVRGKPVKSNVTDNESAKMPSNQCACRPHPGTQSFSSYRHTPGL